jgi:hypothetical protein
LLFGAVILLVPVIHAWREPRSRKLLGLVAATGPILLIGLGLMLHNVRRFDNPFEFGMRYQLGGKELLTQQFFGLRYLWFNFRVNFLEPVRWSAQFPFVHGIAVPPVPAGYTQVRNPVGVLASIPLVWLALAVPLAWRNRSAEAASVLRWFVTEVALLFGMCALTLGLFGGASFRFEVDFLPTLLLLAVIGILGLERALVERPVRRRVARWGWGLLLGFSVVFNLLASVEYYAEAHNILGLALVRLDKLQEATGQFEQAVRISPDYAEAHNNLGNALNRAGRLQDAIGHYEQAVRLKPDDVEAHYNLGAALARAGNAPAAIAHYEQALRIKPDFTAARNALTRLQSGQ